MTLAGPEDEMLTGEFTRGIYPPPIRRRPDSAGRLLIHVMCIRTMDLACGQVHQSGHFSSYDCIHNRGGSFVVYPKRRLWLGVVTRYASDGSEVEDYIGIFGEARDKRPIANVTFHELN